MTAIPEMPEDWWPDMVTVRGTMEHDGGRLELQFAMSAEDLVHPFILQNNLEGLRLALWQEMHGGTTKTTAAA